MEIEDETGEFDITLKVRKSAISSVEKGIARINSSYAELLGEEKHRTVTLSNGKKKIVVRLIADRFVPEGYIVLREGDMENLDVSAEEDVELTPYHTLSEDIKANWIKLKDKIRRKESDTEGEDEN
ncbi:MAG: hypothetical protein ACMUIG_03445 [Thermoplasmatota archaeon]